MAKVSLHTGNVKQVTCVSNAFIDEYMKDANGEYVKIYLYLLRCLGQDGEDFSISHMADALDHTEKDIKRALQYWEKLHLLHLEYNNMNELSGICVVDSLGKGKPSGSTSQADVSPAPSAMVSNASVSSNASVTEKAPKYTADQLKVFKENDDIKELLFITQTYLGRTLSMNDTNTILYWYDGMGFSTDLIEYLVEYCVEKGHTNIRYMEKVALGWANSNIRTVEEAKQAASIHSQAYYAVMKALGISGRNLIETETNYIEKWTNEYGFSLDIITEACKRTILTIQKPSFEYTDSILTNWYNASVHHLEDIAKIDATRSASKKQPKAQTNSNNRFINFEQRDNYDYDDLESKLLQQ